MDYSNKPNEELRICLYIAVTKFNTVLQVLLTFGVLIYSLYPVKDNQLCEIVIF